jgi:hypothetical protein
MKQAYEGTRECGGNIDTEKEKQKDINMKDKERSVYLVVNSGSKRLHERHGGKRRREVRCSTLEVRGEASGAKAMRQAISAPAKVYEGLDRTPRGNGALRQTNLILSRFKKRSFS